MTPISPIRSRFWDVLFGTYAVPGVYIGAYGFEGTPVIDVLKRLIRPYLEWTKPLAK